LCRPFVNLLVMPTLPCVATARPSSVTANVVGSTPEPASVAETTIVRCFTDTRSFGGVTSFTQ